MLVEPAAAVTVPAQVFDNPLGVATSRPVGKVSVKATPVSATVFAAGLLMVKVNALARLTEMAAGLKAAAMVGGATTTMPAEAVPPLPPCVEVIAVVVLFCWPATVPLMFTEKVQEVLCARLAADSVTAFVPCVAVMDPPPQVPARPLGVETTSPAGNVSLKAMPLSVVAVLLFCTVKLREVEPPSGMLAAPKDLMITGGATTVMLALEVLPVP